MLYLFVKTGIFCKNQGVQTEKHEDGKRGVAVKLGLVRRQRCIDNKQRAKKVYIMFFIEN
jgi:hypothetical protein